MSTLSKVELLSIATDRNDEKLLKELEAWFDKWTAELQVAFSVSQQEIVAAKDPNSILAAERRKAALIAGEQIFPVAFSEFVMADSGEWHYRFVGHVLRRTSRK